MSTSLYHYSAWLDELWDIFGEDRVMFGSDWPVCLLASPYDGVVEAASEAIGDLSPQEKAAFWGGNASEFYRLETP